MKRFTTVLKDQAILYAIKRAEELLLPTSPMLAEIRKKNDFQYNSGTGEEIYAKLVQERPLVEVKTYRPWNPWTKAVGYFDGSDIYINERKILPHLDMVGLLCHEYTHACGMTHGNNYRTEHKNLYSAPYWVTSYIEKLASICF